MYALFCYIFFLSENAADLWQMAEKCLTTIWAEIRLRCCFYLLSALRKSNYNCDINGVETDRFVDQFNKVGCVCVCNGCSGVEIP
jgi:hypothetical protein